jgi:RNA polymerase sigma factor (sigma-70 family)
MEDVAAGTSPRTVRRGRPRLEAAPTPDERLALILEHAPSLLRTARRYSYCADDAQDAYQRAMEIFLRRAESLEPAGMVGWMRTVVKHEALAVRESRGRMVSGEEVDLDRHEAGRLPTPEDRAESFDRVTRAAEALQRLKPQEVQALVLKAQGLSYHEIAERMNWSYTKVNRCLTEGRRSFLDRFASIESGAECARWAPLLSLMADGEATPEQLLEVRPHLRRCAGCRATVRGFHQTGARVAALVPVAALPPAGSSATGGEAVADGVGLFERLHHAVHALVGERGTLAAHKVGMTIEGVSTAKLAAAAASAAALTGGGAAVVERAGEPAGRAPRAAVHAVGAPVARPASASAATSAPAAASAPGPVAERPSARPSRVRARARASAGARVRAASARKPAAAPASSSSRPETLGEFPSGGPTNAAVAPRAPATAPASPGAQAPGDAGRASEFTFERSPPRPGASPGGSGAPSRSPDATRSPTGSTGASGSASPGEFGP